jgi:hypothetical protein
VGLHEEGNIYCPERISYAKVRALIDDSTKWWNYELIKEVFPEDEASYRLERISYGKRVCVGG